MQTIGERLEDARRKRGLSLREAAEATKVRGDFLQSFENNSFDIGLPELYVRGFLRTYAIYLKISPEKIVSDYVALVLGEARPSRERQRELFGRMEIPSREDEGTAAVAAPERGGEGRDGGGEAGDRGPAPEWPKMAMVGGAAVAVLALVIYAIAALVGGGVREEPTGGVGPDRQPGGSGAVAPVTPGPAAEEFFLVATGPVTVEVRQQSDGQMLYRGNLTAGQRVPLVKRGKVFVSVDLCENLQFELGGQRFGGGARRGRQLLEVP